MSMSNNPWGQYGEWVSSSNGFSAASAPMLQAAMAEVTRLEHLRSTTIRTNKVLSETVRQLLQDAMAGFMTQQASIEASGLPTEYREAATTANHNTFVAQLASVERVIASFQAVHGQGLAQVYLPDEHWTNQEPLALLAQSGSPRRPKQKFSFFKTPPGPNKPWYCKTLSELRGE